MFGKKSQSSNDKFVMAAGKKAGNLKTPAVTKVASKPSKLPSADAMKRGTGTNQNKPLPLGKSNTFNTTKLVPR